MSIRFPILGETLFLNFHFQRGKSLEKKLAGVGQGGGFLTRDASGDLVNEEFAESDVDGGGGLEIAYGGEDIRRDGVGVGDTTHLAAKVIVAKGGVAGVSGRRAAFTVGAEMLAAAIGDG
jgi:hypothetical protein